MSSPGLSQDLDMRIYQSCLQKLKNNEEDQNQKKKIEAITNRLIKNRDRKEINALNPSQLEVFKIFLDVFLSAKRAYEKVSKVQEFKSFIKSDFNITNYLLENHLNIPMPTTLNRQSLISKYVPYLTINFKKTVPGIPNKFITEWMLKTKQKASEEPEKPVVKPQPRPQQEPPKIDEKKKQQPAISAATQFQRQRPAPPPPSSQQDAGESQEAPQPPKKSEQDIQKQARERQREQRERNIERDNERRNRQKQEDRQKDEKRRREELTRKADQRQASKINKSKAQLIQRYIIESRRDLTFEKGKNKEVSQFLANKLEQFLKHTLDKLYNISCLKNKKNPKFGNQLGYFAEQNRRVQYYSEFYFQPNSKIYSLGYKHKQEIYSNLRLKEIKKEDELRNALETKTNQGDKKIDKRIESYILKPRPKQTELNLVPFRDDREYGRGLSNAVTISLEHVIYFLENHVWLKNSLLLFNVYNRF